MVWKYFPSLFRLLVSSVVWFLCCAEPSSRWKISKARWGCREMGTPHCSQVQVHIAIMENKLETPQTMKNRADMSPSYSAPEWIFKGDEVSIWGPTLYITAWISKILPFSSNRKRRFLCWNKSHTERQMPHFYSRMGQL